MDTKIQGYESHRNNQAQVCCEIVAYRNELEDGDSAAGSYCVFDGKQIAVVGEKMVKCGKRRVHCAA